MEKNRKKEQTYRSMIEFEKKFFPKSFKKRMEEKPTDAHALGTILANESLEKIRKQIAK
jgi:hypothetical protein